MSISNHAVILTQNSDIYNLAAKILSEIDISSYSGDDSLNSILELKNKIMTEGNLAFLKKEILRFIQQNGYPFITIIDLKIKSDLDSDHDNMKIFKTLLISYIIIMQSDEFKNISCNLLILMNKNDYLHFNEITRYPQNILSMIKTNDERLNSIIKEYTVSTEKFKKNFNILATDTEKELSIIRSEIILFINMIKAKEKLRSKLLNGNPASGAGPKINAALPANVVLRSGSSYFKNGDAPEVYEEKMNLVEKEIYINGNFTSYTRLDVIERLLKLIKTGFGSDYIIKKGDGLTVNIPGNSVIDSTTPITLAQLLSKELTEFKNIKIKISPVHYKMMQQSQGFSMIQKNIIIQEE